MNLRSIAGGVLLALSACNLETEGVRSADASRTVLDAAIQAADDASATANDANVTDLDAGTSSMTVSDASVSEAGAVPLPCNGHASLCSRRYNEVAYPSTHNSHAAQAYGYGGINANQLSGLDKQLDDGVRGFLMDVYDHNGQHVLCHGPCQLKNTPHADWLKILRTFLESHPREVITIIYQDGLPADQIAQDFMKAGLTSTLYTHVMGAQWPTLNEMIAANTRLVVTAENGRPPPAWFHHVWDLAWDTPYEFRDVADFSCELNRGTLGNPLFLVNHWLSSGLGSVFLPSEDGAKQANTYDVLWARVQTCRMKTGQLPNFVAVDFYQHGDLFKVVAALNGL